MRGVGCGLARRQCRWVWNRGWDGGLYYTILPPSFVRTYTWPSTQTFSILVSQRIHKLQMCGAQGADRNCLANAQLLPTNLQAIRVSTEITIISTNTHTYILGQQQLLLPLHVLVAPCRCCCRCCCSSYPCSCSCCCRPVVLRSFVCNLMRAFS